MDNKTQTQFESLQFSYKRLIDVFEPFRQDGETTFRTAQRLLDKFQEYEKLAGQAACTYCGFLAAKNSEAIREHIAECVKHPVGLAVKAIESLEATSAQKDARIAELDKLVRGFREHHCGQIQEKDAVIEDLEERKKTLAELFGNERKRVEEKDETIRQLQYIVDLCKSLEATAGQKDAEIKRLTAALNIYEEKLKNIVSVANSFGPDHPMPISTELCAKEAIESLHSAKGLLRNESSGSNDSLLGEERECRHMFSECGQCQFCGTLNVK